MLALVDAAVEPSYDERLLAIKTSAVAQKVIEQALDKLSIDYTERRRIEREVGARISEITARAAAEIAEALRTAIERD